MYREDRRLVERPVEARDFVYGDDRGILQQGVPTGYNIPDDERFNAKGKPIVNPKAPLQEVMSSIEDTYDPESELASFQYLMVTGQVETGEVYGSELMKVKLDFISGKDWEVVHGSATGESQISRKTSGKGLVTWNMDFDIGWRTLTPSGWPQLVLQFIGPNSMGNECLRGYACIHLPTTPGRHTRKARIFCPVKDSWWSIFKSKLFGVESIITDDPELIASAEGREVTAVMYIGCVNIVFNIMQRNYTRFGYLTC